MSLFEIQLTNVKEKESKKETKKEEEKVPKCKEYCLSFAI